MGSYLDNVWRLLHVHHEGEDEYLTPRLVERGAADEAAEAARVAAEHQTLINALAPAQDALAAWRADPTPATADALVAANARLTDPLTAHLDEEEQIVVPLAIHYLAPQEWNQMPGEGLAAFTGDKIWLVIGLIQEQMPGAMVGRDERSHARPTGGALVDVRPAPVCGLCRIAAPLSHAQPGQGRGQIVGHGRIGSGRAGSCKCDVR